MCQQPQNLTRQRETLQLAERQTRIAFSKINTQAMLSILCLNVCIQSLCLILNMIFLYFFMPVIVSC